MKIIFIKTYELAFKFKYHIHGFRLSILTLGNILNTQTKKSASQMSYFIILNLG